MVFYNTTGSEDVVRTAAAVFKHVTMVGNFVAASDSPFDISNEERRQNLLRFKDPDGSPTFLRNEVFKEELERLTKMPLPDMGAELRNSDQFTIITDDNMACEYSKRKGYWFEPNNSWIRMFSKLSKK